MDTQTQILHSIKLFLEEETGIPSLILYDGIDLPSDKPFVTVRQMQNNYLPVSKRKETMSISYGVRLGLFENSSHERMASQEAIKDLLLFEDIPLYDVEGTKTGETLGSDLLAVVPLDAEDVTSDTYTHRVYFDLDIQTTKHKNRGRS
jgi:hypothetical protein